jgi:hypothetical protein
VAPSHQRRLARQRGLGPRSPTPASQPEHRNAADAPPRLELACLLRGELAAQKPVRVAAHQYLTRRGALVEPGRDLRRQPDQIVGALLRRPPLIADDDDPRVDADPRL